MLQLLISIVALIFSMKAFATPNFQKQIRKTYPGFQVLTKNEFNTESIKTKEPGLISGDFNGDKIVDYAAMLRSPKKKRYEAGKNSYDYYEGKVVVCHGNKDKSYKCQKISEGQFTIPQESYLSLVKPQKTGCYSDSGAKDYVDVKTDAIGWYYPEKGGSHYIFQKDGTYKNCVTSD